MKTIMILLTGVFILRPSFGSAQEVKASVDDILKAKSVVIDWPHLVIKGEKRMFLAAYSTLVIPPRSIDLNTGTEITTAANDVCFALGFSGSIQFETVEVGYIDSMAKQSVESVVNGNIVDFPITDVSTAHVRTGFSHFEPIPKQPFAIFKMLRCKK